MKTINTAEETLWKKKEVIFRNLTFYFQVKGGEDVRALT